MVYCFFSLGFGVQGLESELRITFLSSALLPFLVWGLRTKTEFRKTATLKKKEVTEEPGGLEFQV